jgi:hypothetical protein
LASEKHSARVTANIEFADGKVREVKPLTIKSLRKFIKTVEDLDLGTGTVNDDTIDKMVDAAAIVMGQIDPKLAEDRDALEDMLDMDVFNKLMSVAMGNRVTDPNE